MTSRFDPAGVPWADPKHGRQRRLAVFLHAAIAAAGVAALCGLLLPGQAGRVAAGLALGVAIVAPLLRVAWLGVRWFHKGDRRYALAALALLLVVAVGYAIA